MTEPLSPPPAGPPAGAPAGPPPVAPPPEAPVDIAAPLPPRMLSGRYQLGEIVGYGGMAEVHRGRDIRLGREVAVKTLRVDLARDPSFQARFRREAQSAAALNHPAIVAVYDTGEDTLDGRPVPYIVMEFVEGRTLRDVLAGEGRLHWTRALEVTAEVLTALEYSHRQGIVHRDIKPGNVMLTDAGAVKVMDFGIARAATAGATMTQTATVIGTAQYLSPEQARGEAVDARSDLYSTGCLLYELLTGRPPFTGDSPVAIAYQHVREDPLPPSRVNQDVPPGVDAVVLKAMAKNPANRYQSAAEMAADIERALSGQPVHATPILADDGATQRIRPAPTATLPTYAPPPAPADAARGRGWRVAGYALLALAVLALLGTAVALLGPRVLRGLGAGSATQVPTVVDAPLDVARTRLQSAGLRVGTVDERTDPKPSGTMIDQSPEAGTGGRTGTAVDLSVSGGRQLAGVPNVVGLPVETARDTLRRAGLAAGAVTQKDSDQKAGRVLSTDPPADTEVATGTKVALVVASGKAGVPYVVGQRRTDAEGVLERAGFTVDVRSRDTANRDQDGQVLAQQPTGPAASGSTVTSTVGTHRAPTPPPAATPPPTTRPPRTLTHRPGLPRPAPSCSPGPGRSRARHRREPAPLHLLDQRRRATQRRRVPAPGQPVRQQQVATLGQHRLRVELHPLHAGERPVPQRQHDPVVGSRGHRELIRQRPFLDDQGVVAGRGERVGQPGEHPLPVVAGQRRLAVQQFGSAAHRRAVRHPDHLVPEADAEDRHPARVLAHQRHADPGVLRAAGPGGEQHPVVRRHLGE